MRDEESKTHIIFQDNFNDGDFEGWSIENGNGGATWALVSNRNGGSIDGTFFMLADSDNNSSDIMEEGLISPELIVTEVNGRLVLKFDHNYQQFSSSNNARIDIYDGTKWNIGVKLYTEDVGSFLGSGSTSVQEEIDITSYLINDSITIRFFYEGDWDWYWAIDNVEIIDIVE